LPGHTAGGRTGAVYRPGPGHSLHDLSRTALVQAKMPPRDALETLPLNGSSTGPLRGRSERTRPSETGRRPFDSV